MKAAHFGVEVYYIILDTSRRIQRKTNLSQ